MHIHFSVLGWFQIRVMVFVALTLFLVCADKKEEGSMVGLSNHTVTSMVGNHQKQRQSKQLGMKPFDLYLSRKRKVPNASDPLHNR